MDEITKQVVELWKVVGEAHGELWKLYLAVGSAIVGFSFSDKFSRIQPVARKSLFFLLLVFLVSNFFSIYFNFRVLNAATTYLKSIMQGPVSSIGQAMFVTPIEVIVGLHLLLDAFALTIVGIRAFSSAPPDAAKLSDESKSAIAPDA